MDRQTFEKFMKPGVGLLVFGIIMGGFGLVLVFGGMILPGLVAMVPGVLCGWASWSSISRFKKQMEELETSGRLDSVIREFAGGRQFFKDKLRLGPTYIYGKGVGRILTHGEVRKVYQHVHKTNFVEDRREMRVETTDNKIFSLCKIPLRGKGDQELIQAIAIMKTMNPGIHVGYK